MKQIFKNSVIVSIGFLTPFVVFAQNVSGILGLLNQIQLVIGATIPVLIGLAVLAFSWGIVMYLFGKDKEEGKSMMIWGIIAIFVMTSVWGLVGILKGTILPGSNSNTAPTIPIPQLP